MAGGWRKANERTTSSLSTKNDYAKVKYARLSMARETSQFGQIGVRRFSLIDPMMRSCGACTYSHPLEREDVTVRPLQILTGPHPFTFVIWQVPVNICVCRRLRIRERNSKSAASARGGTTLRSFPIDEAGPQRLVPFCNVLGGESGCVNITVPV